ncbi:MAG TPA: universal stress protein [Rhodoglobus sp.]|nr:universal stress protein [Rhodoglobus sp.]
MGHGGERLADVAGGGGSSHPRRSRCGSRRPVPRPACDGRGVGGRPLPALYAASVGARMLVVGTHGKHGFSKALLGSVSEDLVLSLPCPVVVVRA